MDHGPVTRIPKWAQISPYIEQHFRRLKRRGKKHAEIRALLADEIELEKEYVNYDKYKLPPPTPPERLVDPWRCECGLLIQYKECLRCNIRR